MSRRSRYRGQKSARTGDPVSPGQQSGALPAERLARQVDQSTAPSGATAPAAIDSRMASGASTREGPARADVAVGTMSALDAAGVERAAGQTRVPPPSASGGPARGGQPPGSACTAPQLRRFIKSRSWVPMHELRRRFAINGPEDDVTSVTVNGLRIYLGLPAREGQLLGELLQAGDIGYELSLDPATPVVIGVYPMRPVPRH